MEPLRITLSYSGSEWRCVENQMSNLGFRELRNFIHSRIRKVTPQIPACFGEPEDRVRKTFSITDEEVIIRINSYCCKHGLAASTLVRLLATDPLLMGCLLGQPARDLLGPMEP